MRGEANGEEEQQPPRRNHLRDDAEEEEEVERRAARPVSGQQQQQQRRRPTDVGGGAAMRSVGYVGKHRLSAAIARLDQELQSLQVSATPLPPLPLISHELDSPCAYCLSSTSMCAFTVSVLWPVDV
ncbi:Os02g0137800 [Oryza sativa Japonica Group]|jgi:hypothetical protein|uniref:Os02g0137800 protein n=1 Tax=Oryza sativa subsp. japonica TaxID=39947 RepID=B7ES13_ORYSJ|nr:hypothetical protein EE612_008742 [Oryza sativa]BAG95160.1 unnamed protein product [Oryza sativa Japonica Group]BAS76885.1 Os02g0137800 [Oryza sativa Japonica Group]